MTSQKKENDGVRIETSIQTSTRNIKYDISLQMLDAKKNVENNLNEKTLYLLFMCNL